MRNVKNQPYFPPVGFTILGTKIPGTMNLLAESNSLTIFSRRSIIELSGFFFSFPFNDRFLTKKRDGYEAVFGFRGPVESTGGGTSWKGRNRKPATTERKAKNSPGRCEES